MAVRKVAITIGEDLIDAIDEMVRDGLYSNRSRAIQAAVRENVVRARRRRLAQEARKLSPREEQTWAEQGLHKDAAEWPEY